MAAAAIPGEGAAVEGATGSGAPDAARCWEIAGEVRAQDASVALGAASARAIECLPVRPDHVAVDGLPVLHLAWEHEVVVGGDAFVHSVACESIVAKVCRDRVHDAPGRALRGLRHVRSPAGRAAEGGLTPRHRTTFARIRPGLGLGGGEAAGPAGRPGCGASR